MTNPNATPPSGPALGDSTGPAPAAQPAGTRGAPARKRRLVLGSLAVAAALGVVVYLAFFSGPAVIEPPAPDLSGVDPAVRAAIEEAQGRVRRSPRLGAAWGRLGMVLSNHIFAEEALVCFAQAERLEPDNPRWPYHQGLLQVTRDPATAVGKLRRAVDVCRDPTDGPRLRLAELCQSLGQGDEAREQFRLLLRDYPEHPRAHLGLARLDARAGQVTLAREHLAYALGHPLTRKSALALSAEFHQRQGDSQAAQQELARMIELLDEPDWDDAFLAEAAHLKVGESAQVRLAGQLLDRNDTPQATRTLEKLVREYPKSVRGWTLLGWAQLKLGQVAAAEKSLSTALELDPDVARAWMYRGMICHKQEKRPQAIAFFQQAVRCKPNYLQAHFNLGMCLTEVGKHEAAIAAFQNAVRCEPLSAPAHAHLGKLLLNQGRKLEAATHLEQAVTLNPEDVASRKLLEEARRESALPKKSGD